MSDILKVIEVLADSEQSWEDAAAKAIAEASKSLRGITSIYIKHFDAKVEGDKIIQYRINAQITFRLENK